jgi:hypothetical protein
MGNTENNFAQGPKSQMALANNTAIGHMLLLDQAREALNNGNIPVLNGIAQFLGQATGGDAKTQFNLIAQKLGQEVSKSYIAGGGGELERLQAANDYNSSMSDQQLRGNIHATVEMLDTQQRNLLHQYKDGTYGKGTLPIYWPETVAARDKMLYGAILPQGNGQKVDANTIKMFVQAGHGDRNEIKWLLEQHGWKM